jgi:outer membrane protein assembly factor BamB
MKPAIVLGLSAVGAVLLAGCAKPPPPAFDADQLREHDLRVYWQAKLPLEKGEAVVDLRLIEDNVYCVTNHASVFALYADAGAVAWSRRLGNPGNIVFEPTVSLGSGLDDAVVLTSQGGIWVVDRKTGDSIAELRPTFAPGGAAVASDEIIWTGDVIGTMHATLPAGYDHWRVKTGGGITAAPILLPDRLIFCSTDGTVYCSTPVTKELLWTFDTDGPITARPAFNDDALFVPSHDRRIYCLDIDSGQMRWQYQCPEPLDRSPQITDDTVYQSLGLEGMVALDVASGSRRWLIESGRDFVAQYRNTAFVVDRSGDLVALDNLTGEEQWRLFPRHVDLVAANLDDSAMYLSSYGGQVTCLRRVDVPYLRRSDLEAAMRARRVEPGADTAGPVAERRSPSLQALGDPLESSSKVAPLAARAGD